MLNLNDKTKKGANKSRFLYIIKSVTNNTNKKHNNNHTLNNCMNEKIKKRGIE